MNYDEAIETFHDMHPEYDTANGGTHILHDKVLDALKRAKKVEELLDLYRLLLEFKERYNTSVRLLDQMKCLDNIRDISEEIYLREEELEERK